MQTAKTVEDRVKEAERIALEQWRKDMKTLFEDKRLKDVELIVGEDFGEPKTFHSCSFLLAARTPVFAQMLFGDFKEGQPVQPTQPRCIPIPNIQPEIFEQILLFISNGEITLHLDKENVMQVFEAADQYLLYDLRDICFLMFEKLLDSSSVLSFLSAGLNYPVMKDLCLRFLSTHLEILKDKWSTLSEPTLLTILDCDAISLHEDEICKGVLEWGEEHPDQLSNALEHVRLEQMSMQALWDLLESRQLVSEKQLIQAYRYHAEQSVIDAKGNLLADSKLRAKDPNTIIVTFPNVKKRLELKEALVSETYDLCFGFRVYFTLRKDEDAKEKEELIKIGVWLKHVNPSLDGKKGRVEWTGTKLSFSSEKSTQIDTICKEAGTGVTWNVPLDSVKKRDLNLTVVFPPRTRVVWY